MPDGTPPPQRAAVPQQAFKVETARTIQLADRKLTIRRVAPPIPIPSATAKPEKNAVNTNPQAPELDTSTDTELLHISATVHQKRLAHVRGWTPGGQEFSA